jgi:hypothetical protein
MWVLMNNSYFSIVKNKNKKDSLIVRARIKGDIEEIFPSANVLEDIGTDYKYRTFLPKWVVSKAIKKSVENIDYDNFKDSIPFTDNIRHDVYFNVWLTLLALQNPIDRSEFDGYYNKKSVTAETHPVGYQLAQTIMDYDYQNEKSSV